MAVPNWSPADRENAALRELVTVYRYLSGLAPQDADLAGVARLISERTAATVAAPAPAGRPGPAAMDAPAAPCSAGLGESGLEPA